MVYSLGPLTKPIDGGPMAYQYPFKTTDEATKKAVWQKGREITGFDASMWRHDICGHVMKYSEHGSESDYGWEIDHIKPVAKGGQTILSNLQPLWWKNNRTKSDTYPWSCP